MKPRSQGLDNQAMSRGQGFEAVLVTKPLTQSRGFLPARLVRPDFKSGGLQQLE